MTEVAAARNASGRATRQVLLRTAESLFAERGIGGVSLREIGEAAGQRNTAAVHYHFGDKEGLLRAILAMRAENINRRRRDLLESVGGAPDALWALAEAMVLPLAEQLQTGSRYLGFVVQLRLDPDLDGIAQDHEVTSSWRAAARVLSETRPDLAVHQRRHRFDMATELILHSLARREFVELTAARAGGRTAAGCEDYVVDLVAAAAGVLASPVPVVTGGRIRPPQVELEMS